MLVQRTLQQDPFSGHLFAFRGRRADLIKIVFWDGSGLCLFTKRLEQRHFPWPVAAEAGRHGDTHFAAAIDADRGDRLAVAGADLEARGRGLMLLRPIDSGNTDFDTTHREWA
jgi:transposase